MGAPNAVRHSALHRLLNNRRLLAIVVAGGLSSAGDWLYLTALPIVLYQRTGDLALLGVVAALRLLPFLLLSVPAGALVDRLAPRPVLLVSETCRGLAMAVACLVVVTNGPIVAVVVLAALSAASGTVSMPAQGALLPSLAEGDEELALANSADATLEGFASIVGPALAAGLVLIGGAGFALAANACTFAIVVVAVARFGRPSVGKDASRAATRDDVAIEPGDAATTDVPVTLIGVLRRIGRPLALDAGVSLTAGAMTVLPVAIAVDLLHADGALAAVFATATGVGALAGAVGSAAFSRARAVVGMVIGVGLSSGALVAMGTGSLVVVLVAMACSGAALMLLDTLGRTWVQRLTATGGTGRAFGLVNATAAVWMIVGSTAPAVLAPAIGLGAVLALGGAVVALTGLVALAPDPRTLRDLRSRPLRVQLRAALR